MMWRVVKSTDRGWVTVSRDFDDRAECMSERQSLASNSDDIFAIQEQPSGAVVLDIAAA